MKKRIGPRIRQLNEIEEFRSLGGDPGFLTFLEKHRILGEIDKAFNSRKENLPPDRLFARAEAKLRSGPDEPWKEIVLRKIQLARVHRQLAQRLTGSVRGITIDPAHLKRYFFLAALIPYTAFIDGKDREVVGSPAWSWIERWLRSKDFSADHLRQYWRKQILHKQIPSGSLLARVALRDGVLAYVEWRHGELEQGMTFSPKETRYLKNVEQYLPLEWLQKYIRLIRSRKRWLEVFHADS